MGVRRYRASLVKVRQDGSVVQKALADTEPGMVVVADVIAPMVNAIIDEQARIVDEWSKPDHRKVDAGSWVLLCLPPETLAAVTALHALGGAFERKYTALAISLGTRIRDEYDYARWRRAEREAQKEDPVRVNLAALMQKRNKVVDERVFRKWSRKAALFSRSDWDTQTRLHAGYVLLRLLVESNGWFHVFERAENGRTVRWFGLTPEAQAFVADRNKQNELLRPYLLPMIEPPNDWRYAN